MIKKLSALALCAAALAFCQDAKELQSQARTAVSEKRFSDALTVYRTLLAGNHGNLDYILWIARLSAWTHDYASALDFYDQALAQDPQNVDAMLGKANVLLWKHSYHEAFPLIEAAHKLAPDNAEVELLWSRYYHWQGDDHEAKLHVEKSLAMDSSNQDAIDLQEGLVPDHSIEVRFAYEGDTLSGTTPGSIEQIGVTYFNRKGDIGLDYFHLSRFGEGGSRGGLHFNRKLSSTTSIRGAALFGDGGDIVPRQDLSVGFSHTLMRGLVLGADYRHLAYRTLTVDAGIADLDYYFEKPMWILTSFAANHVEGATTPALLVRFNSQVRKRLSVNVGYGHGTEIFQLALPTDFRSFHRDIYLAGFTFALAKKNRAEATYSIARRSTGSFENMYLVALVHTL